MGKPLLRPSPVVVTFRGGGHDKFKPLVVRLPRRDSVADSPRTVHEIILVPEEILNVVSAKAVDHTAVEGIASHVREVLKY